MRGRDLSLLPIFKTYKILCKPRATAGVTVCPHLVQLVRNLICSVKSHSANQLIVIESYREITRAKFQDPTCSYLSSKTIVEKSSVMTPKFTHVDRVFFQSGTNTGRNHYPFFGVQKIERIRMTNNIPMRSRFYPPEKFIFIIHLFPANMNTLFRFFQRFITSSLSFITQVEMKVK